MPKRTDGDEIRAFVLSNVEEHPGDIARLTADRFGITRQAANARIKALVDAGTLVAKGHTRARTYAPRILAEASLVETVTADLAEDVVWSRHLKTHFEQLPRNVREICHHGFTEMFNNVVDHSSATSVSVAISVTTVSSELAVYDNGVGIFNKIADALGLEDPGQAILELVKGKVTTDPEHHTGEGIFFTSRMFDEFSILSGRNFFVHRVKENDWLMEDRKQRNGTLVTMRIAPWEARTVQEVFDEFAAEEGDYAFSRTRIPVKLLALKDEPLVSRSQAKRLVTRFERFSVVVLDFEEVESIGPAFADEVFRVFQRKHPEIRIESVNTTADIDRASARARAHV